jgi:TnpA family transposase
MKKHEILSPQSRSALFDPPIDPAAIVRHYTFSPQDMTLIRRRRRDANRLGFAIHLAYLRFPGRVLGAEEVPSPNMLDFVASQIGSEARPKKIAAERDDGVFEAGVAKARRNWRDPRSSRL